MVGHSAHVAPHLPFIKIKSVKVFCVCKDLDNRLRVSLLLNQVSHKRFIRSSFYNSAKQKAFSQ